DEDIGGIPQTGLQSGEPNHTSVTRSGADGDAGGEASLMPARKPNVVSKLANRNTSSASCSAVRRILAKKKKVLSKNTSISLSRVCHQARKELMKRKRQFFRNAWRFAEFVRRRQAPAVTPWSRHGSTEPTISRKVRNYHESSAVAAVGNGSGKRAVKVAPTSTSSTTSFLDEDIATRGGTTIISARSPKAGGSARNQEQTPPRLPTTNAIVGFKLREDVGREDAATEHEHSLAPWVEAMRPTELRIPNFAVHKEIARSDSLRLPGDTGTMTKYPSTEMATATTSAKATSGSVFPTTAVLSGLQEVSSSGASSMPLAPSLSTAPVPRNIDARGTSPAYVRMRRTPAGAEHQRSHGHAQQRQEHERAGFPQLNPSEEMERLSELLGQARIGDLKRGTVGTASSVSKAGEGQGRGEHLQYKIFMPAESEALSGPNQLAFAQNNFDNMPLLPATASAPWSLPRAPFEKGYLVRSRQDADTRYAPIHPALGYASQDEASTRSLLPLKQGAPRVSTSANREVLTPTSSQSSVQVGVHQRRSKAHERQHLSITGVEVLNNKNGHTHVTKVYPRAASVPPPISTPISTRDKVYNYGESFAMAKPVTTTTPEPPRVSGVRRLLVGRQDGPEQMQSGVPLGQVRQQMIGRDLTGSG
ncbi:unnamed protein product, partial [Amoebophrya sp. A25]